MAAKPKDKGKIEIELKNIVQLNIDSERRLILVEFICHTREKFQKNGS